MNHCVNAKYFYSIIGFNNNDKEMLYIKKKINLLISNSGLFFLSQTTSYSTACYYTTIYKAFLGNIYSIQNHYKG